MKKEILHTLISCPQHENNHCCGCLIGKKHKDQTIEFTCNECGYKAGYIDLKHLKEYLANSIKTLKE